VISLNGLLGWLTDWC